MTRPPRPGDYTSRHPVMKGSLWAIDHLLAWFRPGSGRHDAGSLAPNPRRILVCNQAHLGDAILATAVLQPLRRRFPDAEVGVLVHPGSAIVFQGRDEVRDVHVVEHWRLNRRPEGAIHKLWRHWRSSRAARRALRARSYDLAIDLYHYFPNSIPLLRASGIPVLAGWTSGGFGPLLDIALSHPGHTLHILERHERLLAAVGVVPEPDGAPIRPSLQRSEAGLQRWTRLARDKGLGPDFVACHVGAHGSHRRWPTPQWQVLARRLLSSGTPVALFGLGADEEAIARQIATACPGVVDLTGQLDWDMLLAAVSSCSLLVSHDSAATHLGAAFGVPRVCLATGIVDLREWQRPSEHSALLTRPVPCAPCLRARGCATMACIRGIDVDQVGAAIDHLRGARR